MLRYYVYIATNKWDSVFYTGVTNNLERRMYEHCNKLATGFSSDYNINKLVFYDSFSAPLAAIAAEKKIKGWLRARKIALIKEKNPLFKDLLSEL